VVPDERFLERPRAKPTSASTCLLIGFLLGGLIHCKCALASCAGAAGFYVSAPQRGNRLAPISRNTRPRFPRALHGCDARFAREQRVAGRGQRLALAAWELVKGRGWTFARAYDHVMIRYLAAGDARPLLDLILLQRRAPGRKAGGFIASITDGQALLDALLGDASDVPLIDVRSRFRHCGELYEIRIAENRGRGRPKVAPDDPFMNDVRLRLVLGFSALATGRSAAKSFWIDLADVLDFEGDKRSRGKRFPFKAMFIRTDGGTGRPRDLELEPRERVFHTMVSKRLAVPRSKYEFALIDALAELSERGKAEGWTKEFKPKIIKDAYDRIERKSRRD
jgi:hypothetical protein